ncbi:hypothetical protein RJ639_009353, partial [Escallonia herrerae]
LDCADDDLWHEDETLWEGSKEVLDKSSDMDREWQRRRDQFHRLEKKLLHKMGSILASKSLSL